MNRHDVTEKIIATKVARDITWEQVARAVGQSKEWTTALCLQMTATREQAAAVGEVGLGEEERKWLQCDRVNVVLSGKFLPYRTF